MTISNQIARSGNYGPISGKPSSEGLSNTNSSTNETRSLPIFNHEGRIVGRVQGDTFIKHVKGSKHMLNCPKGWANDKSIIDELIDLKVQFIEIHDDETNFIYRSSLDNYIECGFELDRGFGKQICLLLDCWEVVSNGTPLQLSPENKLLIDDLHG